MRANRRLACGATGAVHDLLHAVVDLGPVRRIAQHNVRDRVVIHRLFAFDGLGQVRTVPDTFVRHQCRGLGQLQRRGLHIALANAKNQGFTREPRLATGRSFPLPRRHQAGGFLEHVQGDLLAEAELAHVGGQAVDAQLMRQVVKIGVVGAHDRGVQVDIAVTGAVPVTVFMIVVGQHVVARVEHPAGGRDHPRVQTGNRHRRLDRRPRRVQTAQYAVEQWPVNGVTQLGVSLEADAGHEQVGVKAWLADHRQHFAGLRIQGNHRAATTAQGHLRRFLQFDVQAQHDVLAGHRIGAFEHPQHAATSVGLDFFVTHLAVQLGLVETLDAGLADMVGAAVIDRIEGFQLFFVDSPHVTDRVSKVRPLRVMPHQLRHHFHTRQTELVHRDPCDLLFGQLKQDRYRLERPAPLFHAFLEDRPVFRRQLQHLDDHIEDLLPVTGALTGHAQTEAGPVIRHYHAIAVEDQPAGRRDRLHMHPVVFRQGGVIVVLDNLQEIQACDQHTQQRHHHDCAKHHTRAYKTCVFLVVLDADRLGHREGRRLFVVRVPGQNCPGAIQLFTDQNPYQRVRQRQRRQRPTLIRPRTDFRRQPFGAADHEVDRTRIQAPAIQFHRQLLGAPGFAVDFEGDDALIGADLGQHGFAFLTDEARHVGILAPGIERYLDQFQRQLSGQTLGILMPAFFHPLGHA